MDQIQPYETFDLHTSPANYDVETQQYNPMRGNGWYCPQMIQYCLDLKFIKSVRHQICCVCESINQARLL